MGILVLITAVDNNDESSNRYHWLQDGGKSNNPFVDFRRVRFIFTLLSYVYKMYANDPAGCSSQVSD